MFSVKLPDVAEGPRHTKTLFSGRTHVPSLVFFQEPVKDQSVFWQMQGGKTPNLLS